MNTYGIHSINTHSFNQNNRDMAIIPKDLRNFIVTFLRTHNLVLNTAGYFKKLSPFSGLYRIGSGLMMCYATFKAQKQEVLEGRIEAEGYLTGITQIARGALEALSLNGAVINGCLDTIFTIYNLGLEYKHYKDQNEIARIRSEGHTICSIYGTHPHSEPAYVHIFKLLHLG